MTEFTVRGSFKARDGWQTFERSVETPTENVARERVFAEFGSEHGLKRTQIEIEDVLADASVERAEAESGDAGQPEVEA